jgi:hypothetical protein
VNSNEEQQWLMNLSQSIITNGVSMKPPIIVSPGDSVRIWRLIKSVSDLKTTTSVSFLNNSASSFSLPYSLVYACHDIALHALGVENRQKGEVDSFAVTVMFACCTVSQCCRLLGHGYNPRRLELLLTAFAQLSTLQRACQLNSLPAEWKVDVDVGIVEVCDSILAVLSVLDADPRFVAYSKILQVVSKFKATL